MRRMQAYLQLVRLPAVFTAMADIFLGFLLTHRSLSPIGDFVSLLAASSGLYLGGMVLNDVFDHRVDARERPNRPIPSGRVPLATAVTFGTALLLIGIVSACLVGASSATIAAALAVLILTYDGWLKHTVLGPFAMGGCRLLNVALGASVAYAREAVAAPELLVAVALGLYVSGLTWFARQEAETSSRTQLGIGVALMHAAIALFTAAIVLFGGEGHRMIAIGGLAIVTGLVDVKLIAAIREPLAFHVQTAVKRSILAIVLLDATMVYRSTGSLGLAGATAALVIPAATLGRWIFIT